MIVNRIVNRTRLIGLLTVCSVVLIDGCTVPQGAYRRAYGPGPWDWGDRRGYFDRPYLDRVVPVPGERRESVYLPPDADRVIEVPIENLGRPDPAPSIIPGVSDIPEIPDEPTVLPE